MSKHHARKTERSVGSVPSPAPQQTQDTARSFDTEQQMRDPLGIARSPLDRRFATPFLAERLGSLGALKKYWQDVEDLRRNRYENSQIPTRQYHRVDGRRADVRLYPVRPHAVQGQRLPERMRYEFRDARRVLVCLRREIRRRVLFALQFSKKGRGGGRRIRKARWSDSSFISCTRR